MVDGELVRVEVVRAVVVGDGVGVEVVLAVVVGGVLVEGVNNAVEIV